MTKKHSVQSVAIPLSVETIKEYAFYECTSLVSISVTRVKTIEQYAFAYCTSLERIVIPETVTTIGNFAYEECYPSTSVNFAGMDTELQDEVFYGCDNITIYGYIGSTAQTYANTYGVRFADLDPQIIYEDLSEYTNPNEWFFPQIKFVTAYNLMNGIEDKNTGIINFQKDSPTTRAQTVTILWGLEGNPKGFNTDFTDVKSTHWYYHQIAWAHEKNITNGKTETTFEPNANITREDFICMLYNYANYKEYNTVYNDFSLVDVGYEDYNKIHSYALEEITWAVKNGILSTDQTKLNPRENTTRIQAATMIYKFVQNVVC